MSTVGDTHLGGEDFDNKLVEVCGEEFKKNTGVDLQNSWVALQKLKGECTKLRRTLVSENEAHFKIDDLSDGKPFEYKITRKQWEHIC